MQVLERKSYSSTHIYFDERRGILRINGRRTVSRTLVLASHQLRVSDLALWDPTTFHGNAVLGHSQTSQSDGYCRGQGGPGQLLWGRTVMMIFFL